MMDPESRIARWIGLGIVLGASFLVVAPSLPPWLSAAIQSI